ncbi:MAG TPA: Ger(x)C family spore germination protein [Clostridiales bacterium]|nr:Ger(x)C family spore germination protein [Clostridiales bacterium]
MRKNKVRSKVTILVGLLITLAVFLSGCWDRREIEELSMVAGLAIDCEENTSTPYKEGSISNKEEQMEFDKEKQLQIIVTQQYIVPKAVSGGEKGGTSQKSPYANVSVDGNSIYEIMQKFENINSRTPNYEHLRVIIISDKAARYFNLYKLLNAILRHPETPRNIDMLVSERKACSILDIAPRSEDIPAFKLMMLVRKTKSKSGTPSVSTLGDMSKAMAAGKSFVIQRVGFRQDIGSEYDTVKISDSNYNNLANINKTSGMNFIYDSGTKGLASGMGDIIEAVGAAVIKGQTYNMTGWLNRSETDALNWITGKVEEGSVEFKESKSSETIVYDVDRVKTKIKPEILEGKISFTVDMKMEGTLVEDWLMTADAFKEEFIKDMEMNAEKEVRRILEKTLEKLQKELKTDVAGFGKQLSIKYPRYWNDIKDNWEEIFSDVPINLDLKVYIRDFGRQGSKK